MASKGASCQAPRTGRWDSIESVRLGVFSAFVVSMTVAGIAHADPRLVLIRDLPFPETIDARPDGRAWLRGQGSKDALLIGPGDRVESLPEPEHVLDPEGPPPPGELRLGVDGTLESGGARARLPEALLRSLGLKTDRRALAYDKERRQHVLARSRRPLVSGTGYDDRWSIVWFDAEHILSEAMAPDAEYGKPALAASNGVVWVGFRTGVLRWENGAWTMFADAEVYNNKLRVERAERKSLIVATTAFTLGNAVASSAFSVPVSYLGNQRFGPTATTTFVGSAPGTFTAAMFAMVGGGGSGVIHDLVSSIAFVFGTLSLPVVALTTYGTGELAFGGTNDSGAFFGALGGVAAGAAVWTLASALLPNRSIRDGWWWALPLGGSFIGSASATGYLWAGGGFRRD